MDKSFVTLVQKECAVCGELYDTGELLLDMKMKNTFEKYTIVGQGICPEHTKDGYMPCVVAEKLSGGGCNLLGGLLYVKREAAKEMFSIQDIENYDFIFIEQNVFDRIAQHYLTILT